MPGWDFAKDLSTYLYINVIEILDLKKMWENIKVELVSPDFNYVKVVYLVKLVFGFFL